MDSGKSLHPRPHQRMARRKTTPLPADRVGYLSHHDLVRNPVLFKRLLPKVIQRKLAIFAENLLQFLLILALQPQPFGQYFDYT